MQFLPEDDYFLHQSALPLSRAISRNQYDRCFFNGYKGDFSTFFSLALGMYPGLGLADANMSVVQQGHHKNLQCSVSLKGISRIFPKVGPISLEICQPLHSYRIQCNEPGYEVDIEFTARCEPVEEHRHTLWNQQRHFLDATRMTQQGFWTGTMTIDGNCIDLSKGDWYGTRDRSWGERNIGAADSQEIQPKPVAQFYWLWAPLHFEDCSLLWFRNDDSQGYGVNKGVTISADGQAPVHWEQRDHKVKYGANRRIESMDIELWNPGSSKQASIHLDCQEHFYMHAVGYMASQRPHGSFQQQPIVRDDFHVPNNSADSKFAPPWLHTQAFSQATLEIQGEKQRKGIGVLEQLLLGKHAPSGWNDILDS